MTKTTSFRIEIPEDDWVSKFFLLANEKCKTPPEESLPTKFSSL